MSDDPRVRVSRGDTGLDHSQRTIVHNFDPDASDHCCSPVLRMSISPRKRQLLNRRFMIEQENERSRQEFSRTLAIRLDQLEAFEHVFDDSDHSNPLPASIPKHHHRYHHHYSNMWMK